MLSGTGLLQPSTGTAGVDEGEGEHPTSAALHNLPGMWTTRTINASSRTQAEEETGEQEAGSLSVFPPLLGRIYYALDLRLGPDCPNVNKAQ